MLTLSCPCQRSDWPVGQLSYAEPPATIARAWSSAGVQYGAGIGAVFGTTVTLFSGLWFVVWLGAFVGGVIGTFVGLAVGAVNGLALTWLSRTRAWTMEPEGQARRAACTAAATTVLSVIALQLALFRSLGGQPAFVFLDMPGALGAAAAAHLSRRLPPVV